MADDTRLRERLRRAAIGPAPPVVDHARVIRRARTLRARRAAATAVVAAALAGAIGAPLAQLSQLGDGARPADVPPVLTFEPADGWHVWVTHPDEVELTGVQAWAANVPFAADEEPIGPAGSYPEGWPDRTIASLPPDGVVLVATYPLDTRNTVPPSRSFPESALPLRLTDPPSPNYEGQPPGTSLAIVNATIHGRYVSVRLVFGDEKPAPAAVSEAEVALGRLVVAPPPAASTVLDDFGIRMSVPDGWHRILYRWGAGDVASLLAATVPFTDLDPGGPDRDAMAPEDVAISLIESAAFQDRFEPVELPISIGPEDLCPTCEVADGGAAPPAGHSLFVRTFSVGERRFTLSVEFGTPTLPPERLEEANAVLETLRIEASGSLGPWDPGAEPRRLPPGPSFTATDREPFTYQGLDADVPPGWTAVARPIEDPIVAPVLAAFGSWPLPAGGGCGPEAALEALPPEGALVWFVEHPAPANRGDFVPRPGRPAFEDPGHPARWACASAAPSRMELWEVSGRYLEVHVALGPDATPAAIEAAEELLGSIAVDPLDR